MSETMSFTSTFGTGKMTAKHRAGFKKNQKKSLVDALSKITVLEEKDILDNAELNTVFSDMPAEFKKFTRTPSEIQHNVKLFKSLDTVKA